MSLEYSPARQKRSTAHSRVCLSVDEFSAVTGISLRHDLSARESGNAPIYEEWKTHPHPDE
jgi:hypothetical protein